MLPHWTEDDLLVNDVRLHYYRTGHGDKHPLVLVHGFSDNGLCWTPTARVLESEYDVIMPDMHAHGLSDRMRPGEKVDMTADLVGVIRTLGLRRPVIVGHSMGATITYQTGVRFPELASALVLEDPPWWLSRPAQVPPSNEPAENPMAKWAKNLSNQTLDELLAQYRQEHPSWPEDLIHPMCESKKQLDPAIVDMLVERLDSAEANWLTTIQDIAIPMLIFAGNPVLGGIVTPEIVAKVRELNPKVTTASISDVGHLIRFDNYSAFMDALQVFLEQVSHSTGDPAWLS